MAHMASRDYTITTNHQTTRLGGGGEEGQRPSTVSDDAMDASVASSHLRPLLETCSRTSLFLLAQIVRHRKSSRAPNQSPGARSGWASDPGESVS